MSKPSKITSKVVNYIVQRKRNNYNISVRQLAQDASEKLQLKISKSTVNLILKNENLSSPVGRRTEEIFRPAGETSGAGFSLLLGADYLLGLSKILAKTVKSNPSILLKNEAVLAISEAWLMSKAIYNVQLEKIENYNKNELWFIIGKKASKGNLRQYIEATNFTQPFNLQVVTELLNGLQDVHYTRFVLADGTQYFIDGQQKSIWLDKNIPLNFCTTIDFSSSYINSLISGTQPIVVMNLMPHRMPGGELSDFILSFDGASAEKRIREISSFSPKGEVVKQITFVPPQRRNFILGVWPEQYASMSELAENKAQGKFYLEPLGREFYFSWETMKLSQDAGNIELTIRLIVLKSTETGPALIGILTNLSEEDHPAQDIVERYVRTFPQVQESCHLFLKALKFPLLAADFVSSEKISAAARKILESEGPDPFFENAVETLNIFAQRAFFPSPCAGWNLLKMRELFYKAPGFIKRDMSNDVLFNLNKGNELQQIESLNEAAVRFNEMPIFDEIGRKLWFTIQP